MRGCATSRHPFSGKFKECAQRVLLSSPGSSSLAAPCTQAVMRGSGTASETAGQLNEEWNEFNARLGLASSSASCVLLFAELEAFWLAISRALNSRQSVSAWEAGRLSGMPSFCLLGSLEPSLLSELSLHIGYLSLGGSRTQSKVLSMPSHHLRVRPTKSNIARGSTRTHSDSARVLLSLSSCRHFLAGLNGICNMSP